jgi:hypothetical protein
MINFSDQEKTKLVNHKPKNIRSHYETSYQNIFDLRFGARFSSGLFR